MYRKLLKMGNMKLQAGRAAEALELAKKAMAEDPNLVDAYILAGKAEFELANYESAHFWLEQAQIYGKLDRNAQQILKLALKFTMEPERKNIDPEEKISKKPKRTKYKSNDRDVCDCCECCQCCDPNCCRCCDVCGRICEPCCNSVECCECCNCCECCSGC